MVLALAVMALCCSPALAFGPVDSSCRQFQIKLEFEISPLAEVFRRDEALISLIYGGVTLPTPRQGALNIQPGLTYRYDICLQNSQAGEQTTCARPPPPRTPLAPSRPARD